MKLVSPDFAKYSGFFKPEAVKTFQEGSSIFQEGDSGDFMYVVLEGEVTISTKQKKLAIMEKGDIFGDMALIDDSARSADAEASTDCILALVDEYAFNFLVEKHPEFALDMLRVMAGRIRSMNMT